MDEVAIIGHGNVGRALGARLDEVDVSVSFGVRDLTALSREDDGARTMSVKEAVAESTIVLLAVPADAVLAALRSAEPLGNRIVVDCTNPVGWQNGPIWSPPEEGSVAQRIQSAFPEIRVIKGFNHFGVEIQRRPALISGPADAFFAGDDADSKKHVMDLARRMGFFPRDAGSLRNAGLLENLAILWIHMATAGGAGRQFGFRMDGVASPAS